MRRPLIAALTACLLPLTVVSAPDAAAQGCSAVHVLQAAGTGFTNRSDVNEPVDLHFDGTNPADELQRRVGGWNVTTENVGYPSSLGRFSAFQTSTRGSENLTYGESVAVGVEAATSSMSHIARRCPNTRFILIGHSQGASVAGDAASRVTAHSVPHVTANQIAAVILFADPGRSPATGGAGPLPDSRYGRNGELILGGGTGVLDGREGMTGARTGRFTGLEGRVFSLCNSGDMACSSMPGSLVRDVADYASRVEVEGVSDTYTAASLRAFVEATGQGVPLLEAAADSGLGLAQLWSLIGAGQEGREIVRIVQAHTHAGLDEGELIGLSLVAALPNLVKTGVRTDYLLKAVDVAAAPVAGLEGDAGAWLGGALEAFRLYAGLEELYLQLGGALPDAWTGGTRAGAVARTPSALRQAAAQTASKRALTLLADQAGLGPALRDPRNTALLDGMALAGDFGNTHTSYFNQFEGTYSIAGQTGADWVADYLERTARRIIAGQS